MTVRVSVEEPSIRTLIQQTDDLFFTIAKEISDATEKIKLGEFDNLKDATRSLKDLRMALQLAMEERAKLAKFDKEKAGVVYDYALDFDAARIEIGRRLAFLREAGDG
jgi:hypothetical protein